MDKDGNLPQGWCLETVSSVIEKISTNKKKVKQKDYLPSGKYPVFDQGQDYIGGYTNDPQNTIVCELPAIIFGDHTKVIKLVNQVFAPGADGVKIIRPLDGLDLYWFQYSLYVLVLKIRDKGYARHFQYIETSDLPIPPLPEQHRMVTKIEELFSELDKSVEILKVAREQLKVYRQLVLKYAFEGKLTKNWRKEHSSELEPAEALLKKIKTDREQHYQQQVEEWPQATKTGKRISKPTKPKELPPLTEEERAKLPKLPEGWGWVRLGSLYTTSPQNGLYKPASCYGSGTQIIRIDDFYDGKLVRTDGLKRVTLSASEAENYRVCKNNILVNRVNSIEYLGKCCLIPELREPAVFESNVMRLDFYTRYAVPGYISRYLSSNMGNKQLILNAKHAVNQASINQTDVSMSCFPVCSTLEQAYIVQEIETRFSVVDQLEQTIGDNLQKAEALRQSILKKAFEGKLVSQDPNDEPASALLERIKAKKAKNSENTVRRKNTGK